MSGGPEVVLTSKGNSYLADVTPLGAHIWFRDVQVVGELRADITVLHGEKHLFRTNTTLTLTGRDKVAKTAAELDSGDGPAWRLAVFAATEAVLAAEEKAGEWDDLRYAEEAGPNSAMVVNGFFPEAATVLVAPNSTGKSTIGRAIALSIVSGREVIPGLRPMLIGPVLYVAGEDAVTKYHARHLADMCRGLGLDRDDLKFPIHFFGTGGRPLSRVARTISERAADNAAVILDSHQALLGQASGDAGNIRDRDSAYWNAVDQINKPSLTIAHPNRADRQNWKSADGSIAGSDVNQDRARCQWKGRWQPDDDDAMKVKRRRYTLQNTKWSHGESFPDVSFAIEWFRGNDGLGYMRFTPSAPIAGESEMRALGRPKTVYAETRDAYNAGATTPEQLARVLDISYDTARMRIKRYKQELQEAAE